jgi:hypothetical protein
MSTLRDADILRVLIGACESAARGLEAAAALVADRATLGGIIEDHAARHLRLCRRLEHLTRRAGAEPAPPRRAESHPGGLTRADAVVLQACRDVEERTEAAYRLALAVTERAELRAELDEQYDEVRRLRADIDALRAPALGTAI